MTCNMHTKRRRRPRNYNCFGRARARSRFLREKERDGFDGFDDFFWDAGLVGTTKVFFSFVFVLLAPVVFVVFFPPLFDEREKKAL